MKESTENYLETILVLTEKNGQVRSIDIANELNFSKPSVSAAVKKLKTAELIEVDENGLISLTEIGKGTAKSILERHTVLTNALEMLGVPHDIATKDACKIEHHLDDITFDKIKEHILKYKGAGN